MHYVLTAHSAFLLDRPVIIAKRAKLKTRLYNSRGKIIVAIPYKVTVSVQDADGQNSKFSFYIGSIVSDPTAAIQGIVEDADALIAGVIQGVSITTPIDLVGLTLKTAESAQNDRAIGGYFSLRNANNFRASMTLPTFRNDLYVPAGSENIDLTDTAVAAFLAGLQGTTLTTNQDQEVNTVDQAYETFAGKRG